MIKSEKIRIRKALSQPDKGYVWKKNTANTILSLNGETILSL